VFIINMIPIHVLTLTVAGRFSNRLYIAYSTFYVLGSIMAMQVRPLVGQSLLGPPCDAWATSICMTRPDGNARMRCGVLCCFMGNRCRSWAST
jgi:hypothetical protein